MRGSIIGRGIKYALQFSVHERILVRYLYQKQCSMELREMVGVVSYNPISSS